MSDANQGIAGRITEQLLDTDDDGYVDSCPVRFVTGPGPDYPAPSVDSDADPDSTPDGVESVRTRPTSTLGDADVGDSHSMSIVLFMRRGTLLGRRQQYPGASMSDLAPLEAKLGYTFNDPTLALRALTHKSWVEEGGEGPDQERLEFLGDAFLGYVVAQHLFDICAEDGPEQLTRKRAAQVEGVNLTRVAKTLGLEPLLRMGVGARKGLALNNSIMEDTLEALFGAIMTDGSVADARGVIQRLVLNNLDLSTKSRNATGVYNELWSKMFHEAPPAPKYHFEGPENARSWWATVMLPGGRTVQGDVSRSKATARQSAHAKALPEWPSASEEADG